MDMEDKSRYFIVTYAFDGGNGSVEFITNGCYVNKNVIINYIKEDKPYLKKIIITNIIELNRNDYWDYIKP